MDEIEEKMHDLEDLCKKHDKQFVMAYRANETQWLTSMQTTGWDFTQFVVSVLNTLPDDMIGALMLELIGLADARYEEEKNKTLQ